MRSRTEMVTTTFVDSEEDYSDDDDSEEDWKPSASNKNGKKQKQQKGNGGGMAKRGRKRKGPAVSISKNLKHKPAYEESDDCEEDELSEDNYECDDLDAESVPAKKKPSTLPPKKQFADKSSSNSESSSEFGNVLNLLVYIKDLTSTNPNLNNLLCLWRKDSNNLLQKYIRVRTAPDKFLFASSSVYSSFDDKRASDFYDVKVTSIDSTYRRVQLLNPSELHNIIQKYLNKETSNIGNDNLLEDKSMSSVTDNTQYMRSKNFTKEKCKSSRDYADQNNYKDVEEENDEDETEEGDAEEDFENDEAEEK